MSSLKDEILSVKKQSQASSIAASFINHQNPMQELMDCFFSDDWVLCQKSSWPVTMVADRAPQLLEPYLSQMIDNLDKPQHDAVIRNTVRAWQLMDLPEEYEGKIYDRCFEYFADPQYPVAVRVFSMTVCGNIAMRHPSLAAEIIPIIEDNWDHATAAWRGRGKKELKRLNQIIEKV